MNANFVIKELKKLGTTERAKAAVWYFKTGEGQYGHGDVFFGVTVPDQRKIAKKYAKLSLDEIGNLLQNKVHECRLTALLVLVQKYKKADKKERNNISNFYIKNIDRINNWDLVDSSASNILGVHLLHKNKTILYKFARSENLWHRRIAIISTLAFIYENKYTDTLKISELLLKDKHDLIHKAVGWSLREIGKRSLSEEEKFLNKYASMMPRTMLRYAIEKFPEKKRREYLAIKYS